jgi:hypothetical protein
VSISFETGLRLRRVEAKALAYTKLLSIRLPRNVSYIAGDAFAGTCEVTMENADACPEMEEWNEVRRAAVDVAFEPISPSPQGCAV